MRPHEPVPALGIRVKHTSKKLSGDFIGVFECFYISARREEDGELLTRAYCITSVTYMFRVLTGYLF
jgi:hypothetical protein